MNGSITQKAKALVMHKMTNYILASFLLAAALAYIFFAEITVRTVSDLQNTNDDMQALTVEVSELESQQLAIENNMNQQTAMQLGMVPADNPVFIMRNAPKATLSLKTD